MFSICRTTGVAARRTLQKTGASNADSSATCKSVDYPGRRCSRLVAQLWYGCRAPTPRHRTWQNPFLERCADSVGRVDPRSSVALTTATDLGATRRLMRRPGTAVATYWDDFAA